MNANHSTYSLIEQSRSEDRNRSALEVVIFTVSILAAIVSIWQFAQQRVLVPAAGISPCVACVSAAANTNS
jgi:hypothetical protein